MEIAIPLAALAGLYVISKQQTNKQNLAIEEGFDGREALPNTNLPNKNFPNEYPVQNVELDSTTRLAHDNRYDGGKAWTDKFYNANSSENVFTQDSGNRGEGKYYSLTGQMVDDDYFNHNNMVPYFGSKIRSRQFEANSNESLMDNYLGTGSQQIQKKEQSPLFSPGENFAWAYGAPNQNDFFQSRVNPSMNMANTKPFEEQRVAPGLGLGYGTEGSAGFNSGMLARETWMPKTVDELRTANHAKSGGNVTLGYEGPAASYIKSLGSIGQMEKHRPERAFEMGQDRLMTTTGLEKGQTLQAMPIDRATNRNDTSIDYAGIAGSSNPNAYVDGEYMPSKHNDLPSFPLSNASSVGHGGAMAADYGIKSNRAYANNRSSNHQTDYFGAFGSAIGTVVAPLLDIVRPSRKQNAIGNLRPYQNPGTKVTSSYLFNPADRPGVTIRETTENSKFHLNVNANQHGGGYAVAEQQPIINERMNQSDFYYAGNSSAGPNARQTRAYDAEYRQRNNDIKASTIDGRLVPGNMSLMNGNVNVTAKPKDAYLQNNRAVNPSMPAPPPSMDTMGRLQGKQSLYSGMQTDRVSPDLLNALKGNPYALNINGKF
jgi:hypothetical protein